MPVDSNGAADAIGLARLDAVVVFAEPPEQPHSSAQRTDETPV
jgi:hypothetical protein